MWDGHKLNEHFETHYTLLKKTNTTSTIEVTLQSLSLDMTMSTAVKHVPQSYWESKEFENILKHFARLVKCSKDPIADIRTITKRRVRAKETLKLDREIEQVNFY